MFSDWICCPLIYYGALGPVVVIVFLSILCKPVNKSLLSSFQMKGKSLFMGLITDALLESWSQELITISTSQLVSVLHKLSLISYYNSLFSCLHTTRTIEVG